MLYTVKDVSELSRVTIKTLHHYHKIGLLRPSAITEAGYRLYGTKELERLQQILAYKELDLPLEQIKEMLDHETDRLTVLTGQEALLRRRADRLDAIIGTLRRAIRNLEEGKTMDDKALFAGFADDAAWQEALDEQNRHLAATYGMEAMAVEPTAVQDLNEQAAEAQAFMKNMADCLRAGIHHRDAQVRRLIADHLAFMAAHGHPAEPADYAAQTKFFLSDDFHLQMLEGQQTGLAYYLAAAAEAYATDHPADK